MLKRWLAAFMAAALCLTMLPVGVLAEEATTGDQEPAVADGSAWPAGVPSVAFFSTETPSEETWLSSKDSFKGALEDTATAWLIWDTKTHVADEKADFTVLLDNNDTGKTEIVNGVWEDSFDTKLKGLGIELDPNFEQSYVKVSIEYEYSYDLRITLGDVEAWLNIDPDTSSTDKETSDEDAEDETTTSTELPVLGFYSKSNRKASTLLDEPVISGAASDNETVYLLWEPDALSVSSALVVLDVVGNDTPVLDDAVVGDDATVSVLKEYGITLTSDLANGSITIAVEEFTGSKNLILALKDTAGQELGSVELSIDEETSSADTDDDANADVTTLPTLSYHDEPVRSLDTWLKGEADDILYGNKGTPDVAYLMWDTDAVGTVNSVFVEFEDVYGDGTVLKNADMSTTSTINMLGVYDIKLTADWISNYIQIDTDFDQAYNLYLTLVNTNGENFTCHLNIDEYNITADDNEDNEESDLPAVAFYDEDEATDDSLIKNELMSGPASETRSAWLIWDPDMFSVAEKSDIEVYMEKNEVDGIELRSTEWDQSVDALLAEYNIRLDLEFTPELLLLTDGYSEINRNGYGAAVGVYRYGEFEDLDVNPSEDNTDVADFIDMSSSDTNSWDRLIPFAEDSDSVTNVASYTVDEDGVYSLYTATNYIDLTEEDITASQKAYTAVYDSDEVRVQAVFDTIYYYVLVNDNGVEAVNTVVGYKNSPAIAEENINAMYAVGTDLGSYWKADVIVVETNTQVTTATDLPEASAVKVTATFVEDQTVDFALTLTDNDGDEHEVQLNIDVENDSGDNDIGNEARGLKWCWLDEDDEPELQALRSEMKFALQNTQYLAIVFDGEVVDFDDLTFPSFVVAEEANGYVHMEYVRVDGLTLPYSGVITYHAGKNKTYSMPITVDLPTIAFYDSAERNEMTLLGQQLEYTGTESDQSGNDCSYFYLLLRDGWTIKAINTDNSDDDISFLDWDNVTTDDGKRVALVSIREGFEDKWYSLEVTAENAEGQSDIFYTGFEIIDARPGLRFKSVDNDDNDQYFAEEEIHRELNSALDNGHWIAVYYVDGDDETPIPLSDLKIPGVTEARLLDDGNPYFIQLDMVKLGEGVITCDDYPSYSIPVSVNLPEVAFYSENERSGDAYLGDVLSYTGEDSKVYILPSEDYTITKIVLDPRDEGYDMDFFDYDIADDGSYAEVTLSEGFNDERYRIRVYVDHKDGWDNDWNLRFEVEDCSPGLRFKYVDNDENDQYFTEEEIHRELNSELDNGHWIAVYYVDGDDETPIPLSDLKIPGVTEARLLDDDNPYFIQLNMVKLGEGVITCDDYPSCSIPVSVNLPEVAFYSENERSGDAYLGDVLPYTGEDSKVYILPSENFTITEIVLDPRNEGYDMDFFDYDIAEDGSYAEVTLSEGFNDERYRIRVYVDHKDGWDNDWDLRFEMEDCSPGLKYRFLSSEYGYHYIDEDEPLGATLKADLYSDWQIAVFFVDGDQETMLDVNDLEFPEDILSVSLLNSNPAYLRLSLEHLGKGEITYTDENGVVHGMTIKSELPRAGYYSAPEACEETYLPALNGQMLYGKFGEIKTAYLVWDPEELPDFEGITVYFKKSNEPEPALDGTALEDAEETLAEYNIKLTPNVAEGYIRVDAEIDIDKNLELTLVWDGGRETSSWLNIDNEVNVTVSDWRSNKTNPVIHYNGEEYTFGIGRIEDGGKFDLFGAGGGFGATTPDTEQTLGETVYLGAMVDYDTNDEDAAPAWIYDCISDVTFEIVDWINADDLNDQAESNVFIDRTYTSMFNGYKMATADIDTVPGGFVEALLRVTFTVTMPGEDPLVCTVENVVHFAYRKQLFPDMSQIRTANQLNELLSDGKTFTAWIREQDKINGTNLYEEYMTNKALNWDAVFCLELPPVTYDDIIEVNLTGVEFELFGSTDVSTGETTTMPGMWLHKNDSFFLSDINFVAVDGITQEYNGETFTCGILAYGEDIRNRFGDAWRVNRCTFIGFDYGVRNTPYGYICMGYGNLISDCEVGYLIDCAGKTSGNANSTTDGSIFENCKTAIKILGLPEYISPYDYRIYECDFINNNKDIESTLNGRLYCYFNYFGHYTRGAKSLADVTKLEQIQSRPAGIKEKKNATIITNPRYALPINAWDNWDSNYLTIDNGRHTYIFNSQAGDLLLDAKALTEIVEASEEDITINVMGDDEKVTGTWTFNGKEE